MRHGNSIRKFGREKTQRHALMRSLARNLIRDTQIKTTLAKAKELRPFVEKLVTKALVNTSTSRRLLSERIQGDPEVKKLVDVIAPKYKTRKGGYTRIVRISNRDLDGSLMAIIQFV
jgi:large subunit ribosomal protein L17